MSKSENESESEYVISTERRNLEKLTKIKQISTASQ